MTEYHYTAWHRLVGAAAAVILLAFAPLVTFGASAGDASSPSVNAESSINILAPASEGLSSPRISSLPNLVLAAMNDSKSTTAPRQETLPAAKTDSKPTTPAGRIDPRPTNVPQQKIVPASRRDVPLDPLCDPTTGYCRCGPDPHRCCPNGRKRDGSCW
jgi:hypothetical protein